MRLSRYAADCSCYIYAVLRYQAYLSFLYHREIFVNRKLAIRTSRSIKITIFVELLDAKLRCILWSGVFTLI